MKSRFIPRRPWSTIGLLFKWRGGVYQLIWQEVLVFIILFVFLSLIYRHLFPTEGKEVFEQVCIYSKKFTNTMPVVFIVGSYVTMILRRWWSYFLLLPFPDTIALNLTAYIHGNEERPVLIRRTVIRYVNLSFVLCLMCISTAAKKRFPTEKSLIDAGLMTKEEYDIYMNSDGEIYHRYYIPLVWAVDIVTKARVDMALIRQDSQANQIVIDITVFRDTLHKLILYDWVNPPLVYTQVTTISVYLYFIACLFGHQFLDATRVTDSHKSIDLYFPILAVLKFIIYIGWMKVAESLLNPLGEDEVDFDVNYLIERNLQTSYVLVDSVHQVHPILLKDQYWDNNNPQLPYTLDTLPERPIGSAFAGSVLNLSIKDSAFEINDSARSSRHNSLKDYIVRRRSHSQNVDHHESATKTSERKVSELPKRAPTRNRTQSFAIGSFHESFKIKKKNERRDPFLTASTSNLERTSDKRFDSETKRSSISEDSL